MSNFEIFKRTVDEYLKNYGIELNFTESLRNTSFNSEGEVTRYLYNGEKNLDVISMDCLAKRGYKIVKGAASTQNPINTADAFLIDKDNEWYFIEFKDCKIIGKKDNILKKAYANWYMLLDVFYEMMELGYKSDIFDTNNPVKFAREHVNYIIVCSRDKNIGVYNQIRNCELLKQNYTPPFLQRLKDYNFKDVYAYTEEKFEQNFVKSFVY